VAPDVSALEKHACPACGAQAEWNPSKQKLICPFCGAESPYQIDRNIGEVVEHDLSGALRDTATAEMDFHEQRRSVQCQSCRAIMTFDASRVGQNCEFCGSPALIAYDAIKSPAPTSPGTNAKAPASAVQMADASRMNSAVEKMAKNFGTRDLVIKKVTPAPENQANKDVDYSVYVVNGSDKPSSTVVKKVEIKHR